MEAVQRFPANPGAPAEAPIAPAAWDYFREKIRKAG